MTKGTKKKIIFVVASGLLVSTILLSYAVMIGVYFERRSESICGETEVVKQEQDAQGHFISQTSGLKGNIIRSLAMGENGLWIGYGKDDQGNAGISHFDGKNWRFCLGTPHVNAIALDENGRPWVGTDSPIPRETLGLLHFNGHSWEDFTRFLPDNRVYDIKVHDGKVYVATWEGVAVFNGRQWSVPYTTGKNLPNDHIHAITFARNGDLWFGSINAGVFLLLADGKWISFHTPIIGTENIRVIKEHPTRPEIWIGGDGGEVAVYDYDKQTWLNLPETPSKRVIALTFDRFGRTLIGTYQGVFLSESGQWRINLEYTLPTFSLAVGCHQCLFKADTIFAGTNGAGLQEITLPEP